MASISEHISEDGVLTKTAPAAISRGCPLPCVLPDESGNIPYVVASKNPCGAFAIAEGGVSVQIGQHNILQSLKCVYYITRRGTCK